MELGIGSLTELTVGVWTLLNAGASMELTTGASTGFSTSSTATGVIHNGLNLAVEKQVTDSWKSPGRMKCRPASWRGVLPFDLRRHVLDHLVGEFFRNVLQIRLNEHVAA